MFSFHWKLRELESELIGTRGTEREIINDRIVAFKLESVEKIMSFFTRDELVTGVQRINIDYLREQNQRNSSFDITYLSNPKLVDCLKLTAIQKETLTEKHSLIKEYQDKLWGEFGASYDQFADQVIEDLKSVLDQDQFEEFNKLIGTPINWARMIETTKTFTSSFRASGTNGGNIFYKTPLSPDKVEGSELPQVDVFLFRILEVDFLRKELEPHARTKQKACRSCQRLQPELGENQRKQWSTV